MPTAHSMTENSKTMKSQAEENTTGPTGSTMKASGSAIKCMVTAFLPGKTENAMRANLLTTKEKERDRSHGPTADNISESGNRGSSTESAHT